MVTAGTGRSKDVSQLLGSGLMTQPFPCTRLEHEFNRMFQRVPKPETPVPMDEEKEDDDG
jgi:hypothetical protein